MKKPYVASSLATEGGPVHSAALETKLFGDLLNVVKFLAITRYDDGSTRWPGTLILRAEGSNYKLLAKEPSARLQLPMMASTLDDLFALADLLLGAESAPWEEDPNAWVPPARRKKSS